MTSEMTEKRSFERTALAAILLAASMWTHADCGRDQFYDPRDIEQKSPLARPHSDFDRTRRLAMQGLAAEERNLAAFYDTGYMVSLCREKARYWYTRAAERGDEYALEWLERHDSMERLRSGPECFGDACFQSGRGPQKTVLMSRPNGMFFATAAVNGKGTHALIDTGATWVTMGTKTAQELGVNAAGGRERRLQTGNGVINARGVTLDSVKVGNITLNQVEAVVTETDNPLIIGMSFLRRLNVNTSGNAMTLVKP